LQSCSPTVAPRERATLEELNTAQTELVASPSTLHPRPSELKAEANKAAEEALVKVKHRLRAKEEQLLEAAKRCKALEGPGSEKPLAKARARAEVNQL